MLIRGVLARTGLSFLAIFMLSQFSVPARADLLTEGLEIWLEEAGSREQLGDWIETARDSRGSYEGRIEELEAMRQNNDGYLLRGPSGGLVAFPERDLRSLFTLVLIESLVGDRSTGPFWDEAPANSFTRQIAEIAIPLLTAPPKGEAGEFTREEVNDAMFTSFLDAIAILDAEQRDRLLLEIGDLHADIEQIDLLLARAEGLLDIASAPNPDFLNASGYFVVQYSGRGWLKRSGRTVRVIGYQNQIIEVTDAVSEPNYRDVGWQIPLGYSISQIVQDRQEIARESSIRTCERRARLCPCNPRPNIWISGPEFELVDGPFQSAAEARPVRGAMRDGNLVTGSALQWNHENGHDYDELFAACQSLGADMQ